MYSATALLVVVLVVAGMTLFVAPHPVSSDSVTTPIAGYAWSDNIGWIDLNCSNSGVCGTNQFGFSVNGSGIISGYAWSDNIGWISANSSDLVGCPSGSGSCIASLAGGVLSGWLKALSADNKGWDGWISLNGTSPSYGVTQPSSCSFTGYAWGSDVVGWVDFSQAHTTIAASDVYSCQNTTTILDTHTDASCNVTTNTINCPVNAFCVPNSSVCLYPTPVVTGQLTILPQLVPLNGTVTVSWNISNVQSCTVSGTNSDGTTNSKDTVSGGVWNTISGTKTSSPIVQKTIYTLTCVPYDPHAAVFTESAVVNVVPTYHER